MAQSKACECAYKTYQIWVHHKNFCDLVYLCNNVYDPDLSYFFPFCFYSFPIIITIIKYVFYVTVTNKKVFYTTRKKSRCMYITTEIIFAAHSLYLRIKLYVWLFCPKIKSHHVEYTSEFPVRSFYWRPKNRFMAWEF